MTRDPRAMSRVSRAMYSAALLAVFAWPLLTLTVLVAQSPAFEVASVKPNNSRDAERDGNITASRIRLSYITLWELVQFAYQRPNGDLRGDDEIAGGPNWIKSDHFDVMASLSGMPAGLDAANTAAGATTPGEMTAIDRVRLMMQKLLADRFKLTVHHESRELPVFALVMARNDGATGPQLRKVDVNCAELRRSTSQAASATDDLPCGGFRRLAPGHHAGHALPMWLIVDLLEGTVDRNVIDRTELSGVFDVDLQWAPVQPQRPDPADSAAPVDPGGPSIFTAVREQLGLRLEASRGMVDVLVIDRAEKPTPD